MTCKIPFKWILFNPDFGPLSCCFMAHCQGSANQGECLLNFPTDRIPELIMRTFVVSPLLSQESHCGNDIFQRKIILEKLQNVPRNNTGL